jgi:hypothetical protein
MLLSKGSVKLRSLALSPFVLALSAGLAGTGCFFIDDDHHDDDYGDDIGDDVGDDTDDPPDVDPGKDPETITEVSIQADQVLEAKPGEGVGIFVEYYTGGKWRIWMTCDTFTSKQVCGYQIFAGTKRAESLLGYATEEVEGYDEVKDLGDGNVELIADTDSDIDSLLLDVEPGAPLNLEVYIDGQSAQAFVYWVSDGVIHPGAPSNPLTFHPLTP